MGATLAMYKVTAPNHPGRVGFTITKKIGNAAVRNRFQALREWLRTHGWVPAGSDVVFVAKPAASVRQIRCCGKANRGFTTGGHATMTAIMAGLRRFTTRLLLAPIGFYRRFLSPLKGQPTCRFANMF